MAKLKFGSPAWRKKYMKKNGRPKAKRKPAKSKRNRPNTYTKKGAAAKRKRLKQMIRKNPPSTWMKVKQVRVIKKNGRRILQVIK